MKPITVLLLALLTVSLHAQTKTWSADVAPILYKNCTSCHHSGGIAPFPLMTYNDAALKSSMVKQAVQQRIMPPFPADPAYRSYAYQRVLSSTEIAVIAAWADGGAPMGDPSRAPKPPVYSGRAKITNPDLVATIPVYTSKADTEDLYRCFSIHSGMTENRFISAIEVLPGNPEIVHHVLVYQDTSDITALLDAKDPEPGYTSFGGVGSNTAQLLGGFAPGTEPYSFPNGLGLRLHPKARIILQIHYPAGSAGRIDSTQVRFRFTTASPVREVFIDPILHPFNMTDGPLVIPPNAVKTFHQRLVLPYDVSILTVFPHMHLLGKSTKVYGVTLARDTIPFISIPQWDFHWQIGYTFKTIQRLPRGSAVFSEVTYDNTTNNPHNPNNPPKEVRYGESTTDEMILTYAYYLPYMAGDEFISLDSSATTTSINRNATQPRDLSITIAPHPVNSPATTTVTISGERYTSVRCFDAFGRWRLTLYDGDAISGSRSFPLSHLTPGVYFIQVATEKTITSHRFVVEE